MHLFSRVATDWAGSAQAKAGGGSATLSMAYAGAEFADSVMAALSGDKGEPARPLATFSLFFSVWEGENVPRRGGRGGGALAILAYAPVQCTKLSRRGVGGARQASRSARSWSPRSPTLHSSPPRLVS